MVVAYSNYNGSILILTISVGVTTCSIVVKIGSTIINMSKRKGMSYKLASPFIGLVGLVVTIGCSF
jgi:hypothetical protein